jgi:hypothetical protein
LNQDYSVAGLPDVGRGDKVDVINSGDSSAADREVYVSSTTEQALRATAGRQECPGWGADYGRRRKRSFQTEDNKETKITFCLTLKRSVIFIDLYQNRSSEVYLGAGGPAMKNPSACNIARFNSTKNFSEIQFRFSSTFFIKLTSFSR